MGERRLQYSVAQLFQLWGSGASRREIAAALGCNESTVQKLKMRHKLPKRQFNSPCCEDDYEPTPEEIAEYAERARECREAHFAKRRSEDEHTTRKKIWLEETQCRRTSSQSRA